MNRVIAAISIVAMLLLTLAPLEQAIAGGAVGVSPANRATGRLFKNGDDDGTSGGSDDGSGNGSSGGPSDDSSNGSESNDDATTPEPSDDNSGSDDSGTDDSSG